MSFIDDLKTQVSRNEWKRETESKEALTKVFIQVTGARPETIRFLDVVDPKGFDLVDGYEPYVYKHTAVAIVGNLQFALDYHYVHATPALRRVSWNPGTDRLEMRSPRFTTAEQLLEYLEAPNV